MERENEKPEEKKAPAEQVKVCDGKCVLLHNGMGDELCTRCGYDSMAPSGY